MNIVYLITGGNTGDRKVNLEKAANRIETEIGKILQRSSIYETEAWGNNDQPSFYNQALAIQTKFSPEKIMDIIFKIEKEMGRIRTIKNAARIIDIDILFCNQEIINRPHLIIPHPEINNRQFVLVPMNELAPGFIHPVAKKSIRDLLSACKDRLRVTRVES